jgi:pyruvate dehydrogenase E1 component alpha subunit
MSDPAKYRTKEELEEYKLKDPIETTLATIKQKKYATDKEIESINEKIKTEIEECVKFAEESPLPDASEVYTDIYAEADYPFITD